MIDIFETLNAIPLLPRRFLLETPGVEATVPMLRGSWGAALHDLEPEAYQAVFGGDCCSDTPWRRDRSPAGDRLTPVTQCRGYFVSNAAPGYLLRPAPPDPKFAPAVDFFLLGQAVEHDDACLRAWREAARRGLGKNRRPFTIRGAWLLGPTGALRQSPLPACGRRQPAGGSVAAAPRDGEEAAAQGGLRSPPRSVGATLSWPLSRAVWPLDPQAPCRLTFPAPLRIRRGGRLVEQPTLADLVVAACRRIEMFLPASIQADWKAYAAAALEAARATPQSPWRGARLDLHRWSARQQNELDLHGVCGALDLPEGAGELAPLLAAAQWLHVGKGTVMGLGRLEVDGRW